MPVESGAAPQLFQLLRVVFASKLLAFSAPIKCCFIFISSIVSCAFQSEKQRWSRTIVEYQKQEKTLCGDVLVASAFVSYLGYFTRQYRLELLNNAWIPFLKSQKVDSETLRNTPHDQRQTTNWGQHSLSTPWHRLSPCLSPPCPSQTAWIPSSCLQMMLLWLPGTTTVCQTIGCPSRTPPFWQPASAGHWSWIHSSRASSGCSSVWAQSWGWCSWQDGKVALFV